MPKSEIVRVYWRDQDDLREHPAFEWLRPECRAQKNILGKFENHGITFRLFALRPKIYSVTAADLPASNFPEQASSITKGEMLANVGIAGLPNEVAPRALVRAAQEKVRAYPRVHDDQAPLAYGRWYNSAQLEVVAIQ